MLHRVLLGAVGTVLLGWSNAAAAATPPAPAQNMTVSPTQLPLDIAPGTSASGHVTIINDGDGAYDFKTYATPYQVTGEEYDQSFQALPGAPDVTRWVHFGAASYHAEPHQSVVVPYTVTVPAGTSGGGYYTALFYETVPRLTGGSGVESKTRVGVVAYVRVKGAISERGSIESFAASFWQPQRPVTATLRLGNAGNVHYSADVTFTVSDVFGGRKTMIHIMREVLPQTIRRFDLRWDKSPPLGLFRLGGAVQLLGRTEVLPAHYVLIITPIAGAAVAVVPGLLIVGLWLWRRLRRFPGA